MYYQLDPTSPAQLAELLNKSEQAIAAGNLKTAIRLSSMALQTLNDIEMRLLSIRSSAYQQQGELDQAYADASILTNRLPNYLPATIHAARILIKQEKLIEAMQTCDAVLSKTPLLKMDESPSAGNNSSNNGALLALYADEEEELHRPLIKLRTEAYQKLEHRVDLISKLPFDVLALILDELTFDDILQCLKVSTNWRHCILHCPTSSLQTWKITDGTIRRQVVSVGLQHELLALIAGRIKNLSIYNIYFTRSLVHQVLAISSFQLYSLKIDNSMIDVKVIKLLLKTTSQTIEQVYLDCERLPHVNEILEICPNIKALSYHTALDSALLYGAQQQFSHQSLTTLRIQTTHVRNEEIEWILKCATHLQELTVEQCSADILRTIYRYGGNSLHHININSGMLSRFHPTCGDDYDEPIDTTLYDHAIVIDDCDDLNAGSLLPLLNDKLPQTTGLSLSMNPNLSHLEQEWRAFAAFQSQYIRYMNLSFTPETEAIFASAIRQCPALEELAMDRLSKPTNVLFSALQSLPTFRRLGIANELEDPDDEEILENITLNDRHVRSFFEYHASLGDRSTLEKVRLRFVKGLRMDTFEVLFKIKTLKRISLAGEIVEGGMGSVVKELASASLPLLERVVLVMLLDNMTDDAIRHLDCDTIKLIYINGITTSGVTKMINNSKKLKELVIVSCNVKDYVILDLAAKKRINFHT